jgi:SAM-dependent methyltransferase
VIAESRPKLIERQSYDPALPVESFIVPLLYGEVIAAVDSIAHHAGPGRVLDVGCGSQPFRSDLESRGYEYVGMDAQDPLGLVDYVAEIDGELPHALMACAPFDLILCTEVLEHVADWRSAFANFSALLRPRGHLIVTCPFFYVIHEAPYDFWRPTLFALRSFATRAGLQEVDSRAVGTSWDVLGTMLGANRGTAQAANGSTLGSVMAPALNVATRIGYWLLCRRWLQTRVRWGSTRYPLYLSNVAVFSKS